MAKGKRKGKDTSDRHGRPKRWGAYKHGFTFQMRSLVGCGQTRFSFKVFFSFITFDFFVYNLPKSKNIQEKASIRSLLEGYNNK
jgi:hypothetical protein